MNYEKIIEFISIVYHPNKFPLPQKKFVKVLKGIFPKKEEQKLIYNNYKILYINFLYLFK